VASVDAEISRATSRGSSKRHIPAPPRGDIQALRAFAVAAVVLFHVWPLAIPGGYVGVDVFFVISGYLITSQLLRLRERNALRLGAFWSARARRLLPAALLVLVVSTILTLLFAPSAVTTQYLRSIVGSTLYAENWVLAADAVDYLAAENAPPIAQHYWSLSVEEQFYILWPLLLIAATSAVLSRRRPRRAVVIGIGAVTGLSLVFCIVVTPLAPSFAYFATPVRMWEFGFGALIAALPALSLPRSARSALWVLGWVALAFTAFRFGPDTPFPGYAAILPVTATAVLILIGPSAPFRLAAIQEARVVRWVGDNSYGIYLWHWPLVVIAPAIVGAPLELWQNVLLVTATCILAALGKRFVEDPLRFGRLATLQPRTILLGTASAMVVVSAVSGIPALAIAATVQSRTEAAQSEVADPAACRGAAMLLNDDCASARASEYASDDLLPGLAGLYDDTDGAFACYASGDAPIEPCHIGSSSPDAIRLAITGDSHAAMLVPGLRDIAERSGWSVDVYVGRGCVWSTDPDPTCAARQEALNEDLLGKGYDAIIVTAWNQIDASDEIRTARAEQFAARWKVAMNAGITVIPVLDNPGVPQSSADCLTTSPTFTLATCSFPASGFLLTDPLSLAARSTGANTIDLRSAFCTSDGMCPMVAGGVVVYRDLHHITATFSHSLSPYLADQLNSILDAEPTALP